ISDSSASSTRVNSSYMTDSTLIGKFLQISALLAKIDKGGIRAGW
ncbi:18730_t:CDS:2, partial [Rhizophagus irregularis]